jgi:hypothetical protein
MKKSIKIFIILFFISFLFSNCSINTITSQQYEQNTSKAEVLFNVTIPSNAAFKNGIFLEVLDEITGLGLNPTRYQMQSADGLIYSIRLPFSMGFNLKYRYVKEGNPPSIEFDSQRNQVRYRMAYINGPLSINDQIAGWQDSPFIGSTGVLQGYIFNLENSVPVSNVMVIISGMRTFTGADGSYSIANIPIGEQQLTAIHVDGLFQPFQQKAIIAANAVTPANFGMKVSHPVNITFIVTPPAENLAGAPIRLFGDFFSLGNTYNDKRGGIANDVANGRPLMYREDGNYAITLSLPAGNPLEYKYSLGDGFWNAEHDSGKNFRVRKIIIPSEDTTIHDVITTWRNSDESPVTLHISIPASTPQGAAVLIQLNPFVWMEPLPIWNLGNNQWLFMVYSPSEFIKSSNFRILLNDAGVIKNDIATANSSTSGIKIDPLISDIDYSVNQWASN